VRQFSHLHEPNVTPKKFFVSNIVSDRLK